MADVSIKYKGTEISSMSASGTKTLNTAGTYCDGSITVQYTKPSGGIDPSTTLPYSGIYSYTLKKVAIAANFRQYYTTSGASIGTLVVGQPFYEVDVDYAGATSWHFGYTNTSNGWRWGWCADQSGGTVLVDP